MFYQIFLLPQAKRCAIITYKYGIYELNDGFVASVTVKIKIFLILRKAFQKQKLNFFRSALFHTKTRVSPRYPVNDCSSRPRHDFI